jgi:hypothetical protein
MPSDFQNLPNESDQEGALKLFLIDVGKLLLLLLTSIITVFTAIGIGIFGSMLAVLRWLKKETQ